MVTTSCIYSSVPYIFSWVALSKVASCKLGQGVGPEGVHDGVYLYFICLSLRHYYRVLHNIESQPEVDDLRNPIQAILLYRGDKLRDPRYLVVVILTLMGMLMPSLRGHMVILPLTQTCEIQRACYFSHFIIYHGILLIYIGYLL